MKIFSRLTLFFSSFNLQDFFWMFYLLFAWTYSWHMIVSVALLLLISRQVLYWVPSLKQGAYVFLYHLIIVSIVGALLSFFIPFFHQYGWVLVPFVALQLFLSPPTSTGYIYLFIMFGMIRVILAYVIPLAILGPFVLLFFSGYGIAKIFLKTND